MRVIFLLLIILSTDIFADNSVSNKQDIKSNPFNDQRNRLDIQEKEIQHLLAKIEILEHQVLQLVRRLDPIKQSSISEQKSQITSNATQNSPLITDVFDISSVKMLANKTKLNIQNINQNNIIDKQYYDLAFASLKDNKLVIAEEKFASFLKNYPNSPLRSNAYFYYGEVFFKRNMFNKAAINYLKAYQQAPKGVKAADSLLKLSLSLGALKKTQEACSILKKLKIEFPNRSAISIKSAKDAMVKFGCNSKKCSK